MTIIGGLALAIIVAGSAANAAGDDPLDAYRWTSRLLVVIAPGEADPDLDAQRRILAAAGAGTRDRDLVVVEGVGSSGNGPALRRRFGVEPGSFRAILVGKDGGAKLASEHPIAARDLFAEIDAMPMRRGEMRARGR